jgi:hypothetical protein
MAENSGYVAGYKDKDTYDKKHGQNNWKVRKVQE